MFGIGDADNWGVKGKRTAAGFSLIELLGMLAVVVLLAGLMMPTMKGDRKGRAQRIKCINNLKNIGLAFRIHTGQEINSFPGPFLMSNGVEIASIDAVMIFGALTNEVADQRIFVCPADKGKKMAGSFGNLGRENISYFASISTDEFMPQGILGGDRNIATNGVAVGTGLFGLTTNGAALGWTKEMHKEQGNVLMGDGSVQVMSSSRLREAVAKQKLATNWLVVP